MNASLPRFLGLIVTIAIALTAPARATAPAGRYTITGGTVYDVKTKLTWQQATPATTYTWAAAKTYCAGVGASLGGTGWRLPTIKELQTIIDNSKVMNPMIDPGAFPGTASGVYWSSTPVMNSPSGAWGVLFFTGTASAYIVTDADSVRCVR
jgi:hypothetical protein